ncbi:ABC transporter substrate-binding protein [Mesorhizobium xinjiangense]|uniref:ABC transporter substrate-binding protein n=1 Tax=Mesorhizobium xinjiangense TaxID=2678685 RepID=UPI0012EE11A9|nr:ABC transporter substrate-binding protein [Mesorhizobium xinjiangense]
MSKELEFLSRRVALGKMNRRDFLGRAAALGVTSTFASTLLGSAARAAGPQKGGFLKAGMQGGEATNSLDPASFLSQVSFSFGKCWGETLVELTPDGGYENRIAEEIGASDDAKTWTFKIRKDVEFHNGKTVTPEDVLATLERHSDEASKSGALGVMQGIDTMKASGDEVIVELKEPNADLPYLMADYHLIIQPNGGKDDPTAGISAGPYKVSVNEPGVRQGGERFANYWQGDKMGHADQIEIIVINDATARTSALQGGQVHMINRVEPKIVDLVKRVPGVTIRNVSGRGHYVFIMHCNTAPFDNNDLRLALKYAMDREGMVETILRGYGSIGNDFPINAAYPLFSDDIEQRPFDTDKAAFHFKKSGHEGPVLLRTSDVAFPGAVDAAQLYQQSCAKAGITIEVKREPGDGYWSEVWNKQPFSTSYWGGRATQDQMYSTAYLSNADWNDTRFFNEVFDKLILAARGELDEAKRKQMYRDAALMVRDDGGLILPMFNDFIDATGAKVEGWENHPAQEMMNGHALVKCWLTA